MSKDKLQELLDMKDEDLDPTKLFNEEDDDADDKSEKNDDDDSDKADEDDKKEENSLSPEDWKRERAGLLKGITEERKKRQEFQRRLDTLTGTVNTILDKRSNQDADESGEKKKQVAIPIEVDEEGNDVLPVDKLDVILSPYKKEIENLRQMISANQQYTQSQTEQNRALQEILGEDEQFPKAYQKYTKARNWANQRVVEWQQDNGYSGAMTADQALDYVFTPELEAEFQEAFPGADLDSIVGMGQRAFRKSLKSLISKTPETPSDDEPEDDKKKDRKKEEQSRFQKVLKKPSGLAESRNSKKGQLSVAERASSLSAKDFLELTDKEAEMLEQALLDEEKSDGVKF